MMCSVVEGFAHSGDDVFFGIHRKKSLGSKGRDHNPQTLAATSTTGLILHDRPK